jgi:hypothetical protein
MSYPLENWEIHLPKADFDKIRSDPRLPILLNLARIVNALNFCFRSLLQASDDNTPAGRRQYFNSFLFACGVLYEGLKVANTLGKTFGDREAFRKGFGLLLKDKTTKKLQETILNPMRNKIVFHFEEGAIQTTLKDLDLNSYLFAVGYGKASGEAYYKLADDVAINFIIGNPDSEEDAEQVFRAAAKSIAQGLSEYTESANRLIADFLNETNWVGREVGKDS